MVTAMKNRLFILAMLLCCTFAATAQNYNLRIHKNGEVQNQWNTSNISNIGLNNGVATFTINGSDIQKSFSDIDSITFYNINGGNPGGGDIDDPDTIPTHDTTTVDPVSGIHITKSLVRKLRSRWWHGQKKKEKGLRFNDTVCDHSI